MEENIWRPQGSTRVLIIYPKELVIYRYRARYEGF